MTKLPFLFATALLASAGVALAAPSAIQSKAASSGEAKLAKALEGRVAGTPVDCIQQRQIQSTQIYDGTAIAYQIGSTLYVNRPKSGAESLRWDPILVTDTHSSQLCSIDIVRLVDRSSHFQTGFVGLGKFVPYTKPKVR